MHMQRVYANEEIDLISKDAALRTHEGQTERVNPCPLIIFDIFIICYVITIRDKSK